VASAPSAPDPRLRVYFAETLGRVRTFARSFGLAEGCVQAAADERSPLPLYGFSLPYEPWSLCEWQQGKVRLFVPPCAAVERAPKGGAFEKVAQEALPEAGGRRFVLLGPGEQARLCEGDTALLVTVDLQQERAKADRQNGAFWIAVIVIASLFGPVMFLVAKPNPNLVPRALENARLKKGLPAQPEPILPLSADAGAAPERTGVVIPAAVR
jgi:hypothetical protein